MRRSPSPLPLVLTAVLLLVAGSAVAADWPQWRGPQRDAVVPETGLMQSWPEGGPPLAWQAEGLGGGFSSVAVVGDDVYTMGDLGDGQYVVALEKGGKHQWKTRVGPRWEDRYLGPRSTPTIDGDHLYVVTTEGDVVAMKRADGSVLWKRSLPEDFGGYLMQAQDRVDWKFAESPLIDGNKVVVTPGAKDAAIVALDKMTGETIWKARIPALGESGRDGAGYSSVVAAEIGGVRQYVQILGRGAIGVDADTGAYLWGYNRIANTVANIPTPIVHGDHVFVSTGYGTGAALLHVVQKGEGAFEAEEVYFLSGDEMQNHHGGMVLVDGHVYTGTGHNKGFPLCLDMDQGEIAWGPVRNDGSGSAAVVYADGRLVFRYQNGTVLLIEATPEAYREHGQFDIPGVEHPSWPHPVIADGHLYLREQDKLYVYDVRAKSEG